MENRERIYLSLEERKIIETLVKEGKRPSFISYRLKRSKNCVNTELRRFRKCYPNEPYNAEKAQALSFQRLSRIPRKAMLPEILEKNHDKIIELLENGISIREIASDLQVSRSAIRNYLISKGISWNKLEQKSNLTERISALEMQMEILTTLIKELHNDRNKKNK